MPSQFTVFFHGAYWNTVPVGTMSYGVIVEVDGKSRLTRSKIYIPPKGRDNEVSRSVVEYAALNNALDFFIHDDLVDARIEVFSNSQLVINQRFWKMEDETRSLCAARNQGSEQACDVRSHLRAMDTR